MPFIVARHDRQSSRSSASSIAVVTTVRAEARVGAGSAASFTYRAYSA